MRILISIPWNFFLHSQQFRAQALLDGLVTLDKLGVIVQDNKIAMASQLPGYYFDEVKRKYFKILPRHQAPQGAKYSKEALNTAAKKNKVSLLSFLK